MDELHWGEDFSAAGSSMTAEQILAEYWAEQNGELFAEHASPAPAVPSEAAESDEEGVRIYRPGKARARQDVPEDAPLRSAAPGGAAGRTLSVDEILAEFRADAEGVRPAERERPRAPRPEKPAPRHEKAPVRREIRAAEQLEALKGGLRGGIERVKRGLSRTLEARKAPPAPEPEAETEEDRAPVSEEAPSAVRAPAPERRREAEPVQEAPPAPRDRDRDRIFDSSDMSIDEILAEFQNGGEDSRPPLREQTTEEAAPPVPAEPERQPAEERAASSQVARMAQDARRFIAEMEQRDYEGLREESDYDKPSAPRLDWDTGAETGLPGEPKTESSRKDEFDPRFRLDGHTEQTMRYDGRELDLGPEEGYVPPAERGGAPIREEDAGEESDREELSFFRRLLSSRRRTGPVEEPEDESGEEAPEEPEPSAEPEPPRPKLQNVDEPAAAYAPDLDYADRVELPPEEREDFPSFGQYLLGLVSGMLIRIRGLGGVTAETAEVDEEDLGPEVSPAVGMRYYGSHIRFARLRLRIGFVLLLIMGWITLGLPVTGALRAAPVAAAIVLGLQLCVMLLCLDVLTNAAVNLARPRFGADALAGLCCVLTSFDALSVAMSAFGNPHMPLCLISSLALWSVLLSSLLSCRALRKTLRVPAIGKLHTAVTGESRLTGSDLTLIKSRRPLKGFVRRSEEMPPDESAFLRLSPILGLLALLLSLVTALVKKGFSDYLYILSALLCAALPISALLCFALPFFFGSNRIFHSGAAIAGWSGLSDVGKSDNLIVGDRDLFPEGSIRMGVMRILAQSRPEDILAYAGSMVAASGIGFAPCFAEQMQKYGCPMKQVENFEILPGGGMRGIIDRQVILCGGEELMRLMNVRVPHRLLTRTTVLLSVDGILQGIFQLEYTPQPAVRQALVALIRSSRHPIFAVRDFNVTPAMLHETFDVATDGYDFPPYVDRFALSEASPDPNSKIAAVLCREGLDPMIRMADAGKGMYRAVRVNLVLTALSALLGVCAVFARMLGTGTVGAGFLLALLLLCALPVFALSVLIQR